MSLCLFKSWNSLYCRDRFTTHFRTLWSPWLGNWYWTAQLEARGKKGLEIFTSRPRQTLIPLWNIWSSKIAVRTCSASCTPFPSTPLHLSCSNDGPWAIFSGPYTQVRSTAKIYSSTSLPVFAGRRAKWSFGFLSRTWAKYHSSWNFIAKEIIFD